MLWRHSYRYVSPQCARVHRDLIVSHPPENVLICIDNVKSIIQSKLTISTSNPASQPTKLVGVPPSKGRGGNQTPRSKSISIHSSQPLPSPSSSCGSSLMLDKLALEMSKINGKGSKLGSVGSAEAIPRETRSEQATGDVGSGNEMDEAADRLSNMSIDSNGFDKKVKPCPLNPPDCHYSPKWCHHTLEGRYLAQILGPC